MSRKRRMFFKAAQRDASEGDVIKALRAAGATVWQVSGKDIPDLLIGYKGQTFLLEVKTPGLEYTDKRNGKTYKRDGALRAGQKEFFASWTGGPACEVFTPMEALMAIGAPVDGVLLPVHPNSVIGRAIAAEVAAKGHVDVEEGQLITPEHQRRETAAVVPPPRLRDDGFGTRHISLEPGKRVDLKGRTKDPKALATHASYPARKP